MVQVQGRFRVRVEDGNRASYKYPESPRGGLANLVVRGL